MQLIFDIEGEDEDGAVEVLGERMWVLVAERVGRNYIGVLASKPALVDPSSNFYLRPGCEVLFAPEHASASRRQKREREPPAISIVSRPCAGRTATTRCRYATGETARRQLPGVPKAPDGWLEGG